MPKSFREARPGRYLLTLVLSVLLLSAALPAAHAQRLEVWYLNASAEFLDLLESEWIPEFEAMHPGVTVEVRKISWSQFDNQLRVAFAAGNAPDLFQAGAEYRAVMAENGFARPIDDFLQDWPEWEQFVPGTWQTVVWKGQAYGVPALTSPRTIIYNKSVFSQAGLPDEPPRTWEDLRTIALKINEEDAEGYLTRIGMEVRRAAISLHFILPFFLQNEVSILNEDGTRVAFNTPAGAETLEYLADLSQTVSPLGKTANLMSANPTINLIEGRAAMMYGNSGVLRTAQETNPAYVDDLGVAPPLTKKVQAGVTYTDWWAISSTSPHPELAFEFVKFLSDPDRLRIYNEMISYIPPRQDSITSDWIAANPGLALFAEAVLPYAQPFFSSQHALELTRSFDQRMAAVMDGQMPPTEALEAIAAEYDGLAAN
ncbi:MAG: ABC transporter substrate-binding protein [Firmicutes bacterium]|nr:ABC transporter substrate-binding protein [Bacillota bacterium]